MKAQEILRFSSREQLNKCALKYATRLICKARLSRHQVQAWDSIVCGEAVFADAKQTFSLFYHLPFQTERNFYCALDV